MKFSNAILISTIATAALAQNDGDFLGLGGFLSEFGNDVGGMATGAVNDAKSWIQIGESYAADGIKTGWNGASKAWDEAQSKIHEAETNGGQIRSKAREEADKDLSKGKGAMETARAKVSELRGDAKSVAPSVSAKIKSVIEDGNSKAVGAQEHAASVLKNGVVKTGSDSDSGLAKETAKTGKQSTGGTTSTSSKSSKASSSSGSSSGSSSSASASSTESKDNAPSGIRTASGCALWMAVLSAVFAFA